MKIKKVKWRDSKLYITQVGDEDFTPCIIESVGFVLEEDKNKIVLVGDLVDDEYRRVIVIPRENILNPKKKVK